MGCEDTCPIARKTRHRSRRGSQRNACHYWAKIRNHATQYQRWAQLFLEQLKPFLTTKQKSSNN